MNKEALTRRADALRALLRWHRRIGIAATLFVVISVTTGIALNHVEDLSLDKITVESPWLMKHYGMSAESTPVGVNLGGTWVSWVEGTAYAGSGPGQPLGELVGAAAGPGFIVAAGPDRILLLTPEGSLVEAIEGHLLPGTLISLGLTADKNVAVRADRGSFYSDVAFTGWTALADQTVAWSTVEELPGPSRDAALERFRGKGLPLDRVLLDIHSGHILGFWGALVMDLAAILFLVLAITGMIVTLRRNGGTRGHGGGGPS